MNCTTIDWFLPWPEEALRSTAINNIATMTIVGDNESHVQSIKDGIVDMCVDMQTRVADISQRYL